jgi:hypothetical protein
MTDRQRLLVALLSETHATPTDFEHMQLLELMTLVDLVGPQTSRTR